MSNDRHDAHPWSSEEIYKALSQLPLSIEISYKIEQEHHGLERHVNTSFAAGGIIRQSVVIKENDRQIIDIVLEVPGDPPTATLVLTSSVSSASSSKSCIRTLEMSLDPCSALSSAVTISLQSFTASIDLPLVGKALFANGYQSWSTSYAGADDSSIFEKPNWLYNELTHLGLASDMHIYDYPGVKGKVHSNLVTVIRDKCSDVSASDSFHQDKQANSWKLKPEELVLCGSLSEDYGYTYFLMDTNLGNITISQDCVGKQLRTKEDKQVLRTFFSWGDRDTAVWDEYASAWRMSHSDRRFIRSSFDHQLSGWTSWYCHYENISEHIILENLQHFSGSGLSRPKSDNGPGRGWPAKVFQIDDGYTVVGDWLDCDKEKFPRGMAFIAESIRHKGLIPGLWLAPFLASKKSNIVKEHPEWFVQRLSATAADSSLGRKHKMSRHQDLCCCFSFDSLGSPTSDLMLAHPAFSVGAFALDLENQEVRAHLENVFRVVTQEWGFKMLKLDFLFAAAQVARNGKTRGQLMWESMQMVRTWAGSDTILLGCGVPLGASFMLMDYCRIGCDVGASWDTMQRHFHDREYISCFNSLTSTLSRWALSDRFFGNDPDVFFVRDWSMGLSAAEKRTLMVLNHLLGHLVFCSDPFDIARMSQEPQAILNSFFPWPSTPDVTSNPHKIMRVLQPIPAQKDIYMIQVQVQVQEGRNNLTRTFIVVTNLSSRKQHVHFSVMDQILAREDDGGESAMEPYTQHGQSIYFHAETGQFGSSAAAYTIKYRETCVFLRVIDSKGRLCGPSASLSRSGYGPTGLAKLEMQPNVHLLATSGGHILPTTEIQSLERHAKHQHQFTITFKPSLFPKTVTVWLAWKATSSTDVDVDSKHSPTLNFQPLRLHPQLLVGSGVCLASCTLLVPS